MNTVGIRRRGYKKKEEGIVLPAGYILGEYWVASSNVAVEISNIGNNYDFEFGVEPSSLSNNNGYILLGTNAGHCWKITKNGYACGWDEVPTETAYFAVGEYALISGHMPAKMEDNASYRYYVNGVDTGITVGVRAIYNSIYFMASSYLGQYAFRGKVYPLKIWKNGELVRHYVPCTDLQGNGYMYEVVNGEFITPVKGTLVVK